jgi:hypothetical protein
VTQEERLELLGLVAGMLALRGMAGPENRHTPAVTARPPLEWVALALVGVVAGAVGAFVCLMCAIGFLIEPVAGPAATAGILASLLLAGSLLLAWSTQRRKVHKEKLNPSETDPKPDSDHSSDRLPGLVGQLVKELVESPEAHGSHAMMTAALAGFSAATSSRRT